MGVEIKNKKQGFTLIELLVALFIFVIVILSVMNITLSLVKSQRKIFARGGRYLVSPLNSDRKQILESNLNPALAVPAFQTCNISD